MITCKLVSECDIQFCDFLQPPISDSESESNHKNSSRVSVYQEKHLSLPAPARVGTGSSYRIRTSAAPGVTFNGWPFVSVANGHNCVLFSGVRGIRRTRVGNTKRASRWILRGAAHVPGYPGYPGTALDSDLDLKLPSAFRVSRILPRFPGPVTLNLLHQTDLSLTGPHSVRSPTPRVPGYAISAEYYFLQIATPNCNLRTVPGYPAQI